LVLGVRNILERHEFIKAGDDDLATEVVGTMDTPSLGQDNPRMAISAPRGLLVPDIKDVSNRWIH
jgi:hypothetical protein